MIVICPLPCILFQQVGTGNPRQTGRHPMFETLRKTLTGLAAAAALTAIAAPAATAQEKSLLDDVLARGKLIVGTGSTNAPWHFKDEQGNLVGFDIDIAKMIATG